jgi:hypothetical protein
MKHLSAEGVCTRPPSIPNASCVVTLSIALLLIAPTVAHAAVIINEIAWPRTKFAIVRIGKNFLSQWQGWRTGGLQTWCLGKMGIPMFFFFFPALSHAAVIINEIAWMGSGDSANDEWIELYNSGADSVAVDDWTLTDDAGLTINLVGTVAAGGYAVLERTDDASAPGSAFLIYTGALSNSGGTLTLRRGDGSMADRVAGGENWEVIGGDNTTKETAQYTTSGWVTAAATPGADNGTAATTAAPAATSPTAGGMRAAPAEREATTFQPNADELQLSISGPEQVFVNQPVTFTASPSGRGEALRRSLDFVWNFGDLTTGTGREVVHHYQYPGTYVVAVTGAQREHRASARHEVTVLPVQITLTRTVDGTLQIHNDAPYEKDLSGYTLRGQSDLRFPPQTILLARSTLQLPPTEQSPSHASGLTLHDQRGVMVAGLLSTNPPSAAPVATVPTATPTASPTATNTFTFTATDSGAGLPSTTTSSVTATPDTGLPVPQTAAAYDAVSSTPETNRLSYLLLVSLLALATLALLLTRRPSE